MAYITVGIIKVISGPKPFSSSPELLHLSPVYGNNDIVFKVYIIKRKYIKKGINNFLACGIINTFGNIYRFCNYLGKYQNVLVPENILRFLTHLRIIFK